MTSPGMSQTSANGLGLRLPDKWVFDPGYTKVCVTRVVTAVTGFGNLDLCSFHDSFGLVVMRAKGRRRGLFFVLGRLVRNHKT
jgi:hypothetical protein